MKRALLFFLLCTIMCSPAAVNAQHWQWATVSGCGNNVSVADGYLVKTDPMGDVFIGGFSVAYSICLSPDTFYSDPLLYGTQAIVAKYDSSGNMLWAKANSNSRAFPIGIAASASGGLYVFGAYMNDSLWFDAHLVVNPHPRPVTYNACYYLAKFDASGNVVWLENGINMCYGADETSKSQFSGGIALDAAENIYITGAFSDTGTQVGPYHLSKHLSSIYTLDTNTADIFVAKYDSSGNVIHAQSFGGSGSDYASCIAVGSNNVVYLGGNFFSPDISFGGALLSKDVSPYAITLGAAAVFITYMDTAGHILSATTNKGAATLFCIAPDNAGNLYAGGSFGDTANSIGAFNFDKPNQTSSGFFAKYGEEGDVIWADCFNPGTANDVTVYSIATSACNNNVWITGRFNTSSGINLDSTTVLNVPPGSNDPMFWAGFTAGDTLLEHYSLPTGGDDNNGVATDNGGNLYLFSDYETDPFVLGTYTFPLHNGATEQLFLAKFIPVTSCYDGNDTANNTLVKHTAAADNISIFPNPATTQLTIQSAGVALSHAEGQITEVTITNLLGQTIHQSSIKNQVSSIQVDVADFPPGVYFVRINGTEVRKFVKE